MRPRRVDWRDASRDPTVSNTPSIARHGPLALTADGYSAEPQDREGFVGGRVSKRAFSHHSGRVAR